MLRIIRIILALLSITMVTLLFLDFTGTAQSLWPWMAEVQFIPALLSLNVVAIAFVLLLTLLLGRIYCSVICPLGILQDFINRARILVDKIRGKRARFRYSRARSRRRLIFLTIFIVMLVLALAQVMSVSIASLLEPYSAYGRISTQIFAPVYDQANNILASWSESAGNYTFYRVVTLISIPILAVAIITLIVIMIFAWRGGRDYCNRVCPVGTVLGYVAQYSLFRPVIDKNKCVKCGKCGHRCKAKCIDTHNHLIDYTRCVTCFDCIKNCKTGAISYTWRREKEDPTPRRSAGHHHDHNIEPEWETRHHHHHHHHHHGITSSESGSNVLAMGSAGLGRRAFLVTAGYVAGATVTKAVTNDGGLTPLLNKVPAIRNTPIMPPGSGSIRNLFSHCVGCQLCVRVCPNKVIKPDLNFEGFMQPMLDFTDGYCTPECTACSDICPTDAIRPLDKALKSSLKIGISEVDLDLCISASQGKRCGSCARHCPSQAIQMVPVSEGSTKLMPVVKQTLCIGCGSCEYHCPVGTVESTKGFSSAIHVEGIQNQHLI